ncbi:pyridoxine/pyridoxamine 5'-phosphate oxidase [Planctobacterium marinum]|uniref:Pyridoxine/pyridoxamine 5'-phosphate oxidase n=1 Tax=Planctobacterium marinum TaxID=1631968 RepID=A0AA48HM05_9ALTE|nr:pyridoxine/pyridoxamine 5'-phosphate oxidase [Planctobacterium marinum]
MNDPTAMVAEIWQQARQHPLLKQKSVICISTIDSDGFPDARFVDLKQVNSQGFTICSGYQSDKGRAIAACDKVALTAWWEPVGYQIRIQGRATKISDALAQQYWQSRNHSAQVISSRFQQSEPCVSIDTVKQQFLDAQALLHDKSIPRPKSWGGYCVEPKRIELLKFEDSRLHLRHNFTKLSDQWQCQILQP